MNRTLWRVRSHQESRPLNIKVNDCADQLATCFWVTNPPVKFFTSSEEPFAKYGLKLLIPPKQHQFSNHHTTARVRISGLWIGGSIVIYYHVLLLIFPQQRH